MIKQLLDSRLAIIIVKHNYNFQTSLNQYQSKLKQVFNEEYTLDEIENCLQELDNNRLEQLYKEEQESIVLKDKVDYLIKEPIWT